MYSAKIRIAQLANSLGLLDLSVTLRRNSPRLVILAYHRILDVPVEREFGSDLELVSAGTTAFRAQMEFMREHFDIINFRQLEEIHRAKADLARATAIVTFDDGFADNYTHAFPILSSLGMTATIYLSTGYLDRAEAFWFEAVAQAVLGAKRSVSLPGWPGFSGDASMETRRAALSGLLRMLKLMPDVERRATVQKVIELTEMSDRIAADEVSKPLTWDQVRTMHAGGIEFGSHTVNHPILARMEEEQIREELVESKQRIETEINDSVLSLSYPVGGANAFDDRVRKIAVEAGYTSAVSYMTGTNSLKNCDWFSLRRSRIERYTLMHMFKADVSIADLF